MIQSLALSMQRQVKENKLVYSDDSTIDYLTNPPWALLAEAPLQLKWDGKFDSSPSPPILQRKIKMMRLQLSYGQLPTRQQFNRTCLETFPCPNTPIRFRKDSRLGDREITTNEIWRELKIACSEGTEDSMKWCFNILQLLSIEWR